MDRKCGKMKKKIFVMLFCLMIGTTYVSASSVNVKASASSVTKGTQVTITTTVAADSEIYTIEGSMSCSGAGVSGGTSLEYEDMDTKYSSKSFTYTIKPTSAGTVTCRTSGVKLRELALSGTHTLEDSSITITVKEPTVIQKPSKEYSSNNNLKTLTIDGYDITPAFNKDTKEYTLEVPNDVTKVNIKATAEDSLAKVNGIGEVEVSEGTNKIEVKVTAENGNEKIYTITVTVKELDPIEVTIDKKKYTIIRKEGVLEAPENYEKSTIKIGEDDVLCYKNKVTKNILIGLKDDKGSMSYYSYNESKKTYTKYQSMKVGNLYLSIEKMPKDSIPSGYKKVTLNYDNNKIEAYQYNDNKDFYLVYAQNELTGKKNLYIYDKLEGTVERYNEDLVNAYKKKADNYFLYFIISVVLLAAAIITFSIILITKGKHHKHKNKKI